MYSVVEFVSEGKVQCVPSKWISNGSCAWPDKPTLNISSIIKKNKDAQCDWKRHKVSVLKNNGNHRHKFLILTSSATLLLVDLTNKINWKMSSFLCQRKGGWEASRKSNKCWHYRWWNTSKKAKDNSKFAPQTNANKQWIIWKRFKYEFNIHFSKSGRF